MGIHTSNLKRALILNFALLILVVPTRTLATGQLVENPMEVGAPKLPQYVIDECTRKDVWRDVAGRTECLARMGFPSERRKLAMQAACDMAGEIPSWKWTKITRDVQGQPLSIWYQTSFSFVPIGSNEARPSYRLLTRAEIDLGQLQALLPQIVKTNMPPNQCEADTVITDQSSQLSQGVYHFRTRFRTDVSICTRGPCVPNVWEECRSRTDVGQVESYFNIRISSRLKDDTLVIRTDNDLEPGDKPSGVQLLQALERLWNNLTGNLTRSGAAAKYDAAIRDAVSAATLTSTDVASEKLTVPGMEAFHVKVNSARLHLTSDQGTDRLRLFIASSAEIPYAAVCAVRKKLEDLNAVHSGR